MMARSFVLAVLLAALMLGCAHARAFPSDLTGNFTLTAANKPDLCPGLITQTSYRGTGTDGVSSVPHNTIIHDGARCNGEDLQRATTFYKNDLVPDNVPAELNLMLNTVGENSQIRYPLEQRAKSKDEVFYYGFEEKGRFCQDNSSFPNATVYYLFRPFEALVMPINLFDKVFRFVPDYKYIIAVPRYSSAACIYEAVVPGTPTATQNIKTVDAKDPVLMSDPDSEMESAPVDLAPSSEALPIPEEPKAPTAEDASEAVPENTVEAEESTSVCFPALATVELRDGSLKQMESLQIGDEVRTGVDSFSKVFMFTHRLTKGMYSFVRVRMELGRELTLSPTHYMYVNGRLAAAHTVKVGDRVDTVDGADKVEWIEHEQLRGLFNPQTLDGDIVVNGVFASTYSRAVAPGAAHALLVPLRAAFRSLHFWSSAAECGADAAAKMMPRGASMY